MPLFGIFVRVGGDAGPGLGVRVVAKSRFATKTSTFSLTELGERRSTGRPREIQPLGCEKLGGTPNPSLSDRNVKVFCRNMPF